MNFHSLKKLLKNKTLTSYIILHKQKKRLKRMVFTLVSV